MRQYRSLHLGVLNEPAAQPEVFEHLACPADAIVGAPVQTIRTPVVRETAHAAREPWDISVIIRPRISNPQVHGRLPFADAQTVHTCCSNPQAHKQSKLVAFCASFEIAVELASAWDSLSRSFPPAERRVAPGAGAAVGG